MVLLDKIGNYVLNGFENSHKRIWHCTMSDARKLTMAWEFLKKPIGFACIGESWEDQKLECDFECACGCVHYPKESFHIGDVVDGSGDLNRSSKFDGRIVFVVPTQQFVQSTDEEMTTGAKTGLKEGQCESYYHDGLQLRALEVMETVPFKGKCLIRMIGEAIAKLDLSYDFVSCIWSTANYEIDVVMLKNKRHQSSGVMFEGLWIALRGAGAGMDQVRNAGLVPNREAVLAELHLVLGTIRPKIIDKIQILSLILMWSLDIHFADKYGVVVGWVIQLPKFCCSKQFMRDVKCMENSSGAEVATTFQVINFRDSGGFEYIHEHGGPTLGHSIVESAEGWNSYSESTGAFRRVRL